MKKNILGLMKLVGLILAIFSSSYFAFVKSMAMGKSIHTSLFIALVTYFSVGIVYFMLTDLADYFGKKRNEKT